MKIILGLTHFFGRRTAVVLALLGVAYHLTSAQSNWDEDEDLGSGQSLILEESFKKIPDELKCIKCKKPLTVLPIILIDEGNVCGRCNEDLQTSGIRNKVLEEMIKLHRSPCTYKKNGCSETKEYNLIKIHEKNCIYRLYDCPRVSLGCRWRGKRSEMKKHYEEKHKEFLSDGKKLTALKLDSNYCQNIFMETLNKQYLVHMNYCKHSRILHYGLIYFQEPDIGKDFVLTMHLQNGSSGFSCVIQNNIFCYATQIGKSKLYEINFADMKLLTENSTINYKFVITEEKIIFSSNVSR